MNSELRKLSQALLTVTYTAFLATGCGGGGGGGGAGAGPDNPPVAEEEESVVGQALVGAAAYPDPAAEAKIATIGSVLAVNPTGQVYQVQLNAGVSVADAQGILGGDVLYVEKNYLAHPFAAAADPDWGLSPGPQYGAKVKAEMEAAWTAAAAVVPVARATIEGVAPAADGKKVTIAGQDFTAGDGTSSTVDVKTDATLAATNLAAAIMANGAVTAAGVSAVASGDSTVVLTLAPGSSDVNLTTDGVFVLSTATMSAPAKTITIAVIDSGVNCTHEDLAGKCAAGRDFTGGVAAGTVLAANASSDDVGHGTQVAGVAAAETGNGLGIAGVAGLGPTALDPAVVKVVPVKVSSASIPANHALIARGLDWAVNTLNPPADIILISMGSSSSSFTLQKSIENAWKKGALVVAAAGNEGVKVMRYPAAYQFTGTNGQNVLSVTHVDANDALVPGSTGSNSGTWVNLAAPGTNVIAPTFDMAHTSFTNIYTDGAGAYPELAGSSYAAAFVAGAAALVKAAYPSLDNAQLRNLLTSSVETFDHASGQVLAKTGGRFNVQQAMALAATPTAKEVAGLVLSQSSVSGGLKATGTVVLLNGNSSGTTTVTLASDDSSVTVVPTSLSVPAGATSATFSLTTTAVAAPKAVHITAGVTQGKEVTATLNVAVASLSKLACTPTALVVGQTSTCTITLDVAAPAAGIDVDVSSSDATVASVSAAKVNIKSATTGTFTLTALKAGKAHATAQIGSAKLDTSDLTVAGSTLTVSFTSATLAGGATLNGKLAWNGKLPADTTVHFTTTDATNVPAPSDLVVKAGATSATFSTKVGTPDASVTATLTVTIPADTNNKTAITQAGANKDGAVTVQGIAVKSIDLTSTTLTAGGPLTGTVTLNNAPANGPVLVSLSLNTDVCYLDVAVVTVAKSATKSGNFTVTCAEPAAKTAVTLTALAPFTTAKTATLTLLPTLASVALYTQGQTPALATSFKAGDQLDVVVTLNAAPAAGTVVDVTVADATGSKASLPTLGASTVTVLATKTTGKVTLTGAGSVGGKVVITATFAGVNATTTATYTAPALSSLAVVPTTILEGGATTLTVTTEAASGATDVALTYSVTGALSSPPTKVTVGDTNTSQTATLTAVSSGLSASKAVVVTGTLNGLKKTTTVTVLPATFNSVGTAGATNITKSTTVQVPVALSTAQTITCTVDPAKLVSGLTAPGTVAFSSATSVNLALTADGTVSAGAGGTLDVTCGGVTKTLTVTIQ